MTPTRKSKPRSGTHPKLVLLGAFPLILLSLGLLPVPLSAHAEEPQLTALTAACGPFTTGYRVAHDSTRSGSWKLSKAPDTSRSYLSFYLRFDNPKATLTYLRPETKELPEQKTDYPITVVHIDTKKVTFIDSDAYGVYMYTLYFESKTAAWSKHITGVSGNTSTSLFVANCKIDFM